MSRDFLSPKYSLLHENKYGLDCLKGPTNVAAKAVFFCLTNNEKFDYGVKTLLKNAHLLFVNSAFCGGFCLVLKLLVIRER